MRVDFEPGGPPPEDEVVVTMTESEARRVIANIEAFAPSRPRDSDLAQLGQNILSVLRISEREPGPA
jgi:hypothetical protein